MGRRLLIFDFDGTLADTFDLFLDAFDEAAALYRFELLTGIIWIALIQTYTDSPLLRTSVPLIFPS
jgi:phosphoglycolate phosphatase-like HAD superfamily hydrolase